MPDLYSTSGTLWQDRLKTVSLNNDFVNEWSNLPMPGGDLSSADSSFRLP